MDLALFDVDGPLVIDRTAEFFNWVNSKLKITPRWSYARFVATGDWTIATGGLLPEQTSRLYHRFTQSAACPDMQVTPGASVALRQLEQLTKHIATARTQTLRPTTTRFLQKHIGFFADFHFEVHWEKATLARDLKARFIVDDNQHLLRAVALSSTTKPILFPTRVQRNLDDLAGVIVLKAEARVIDGMSLDDFLSICLLAWQEITAILKNGSRKC